MLQTNTIRPIANHPQPQKLGVATTTTTATTTRAAPATPPLLKAAFGVLNPITPLRRKADQTANVRPAHVGEALAMMQARLLRDQILARAYEQWEAIESKPRQERTPGQEYFAELMDRYECKYGLLCKQPDGASTRVLQWTLDALHRGELMPTGDSKPATESAPTQAPNPAAWAQAMEKARGRPPAESAPNKSSIGAQRKRALNASSTLPSKIRKAGGGQGRPPLGVGVRIKPPPLRASATVSIASETVAILRNASVLTRETESPINSEVDALFDRPPSSVSAC